MMTVVHRNSILCLSFTRVQRENVYSIETVMYKVPHADLNVILYCHDPLGIQCCCVGYLSSIYLYILLLTNIILKECRCCVHLCIRVYPFVSLLMCNGIEYIYDATGALCLFSCVLLQIPTCCTHLQRGKIINV